MPRHALVLPAECDQASWKGLWGQPTPPCCSQGWPEALAQTQGVGLTLGGAPPLQAGPTTLPQPLQQ